MSELHDKACALIKQASTVKKEDIEAVQKLIIASIDFAELTKEFIELQEKALEAEILKRDLTVDDRIQIGWEKVEPIIQEMAKNLPLENNGTSIAFFAEYKELARKIIESDDELSPHKAHMLWLDEMEHEGWEYGEVFNIEDKTHPMFMNYEDLPPEYRAFNTFFYHSINSAKYLSPKLSS